VSRPAGTAAPLVPRDAQGRPRGLRALAQAARGCQACPLYENATQAVFGAGPVGAPLMLVGEQPGDREDREGSPFVGPAGAALDRALAAAGLSRAEVYVTNVVKHFKFVQQGKRRLHQKPRGLEIKACRPWLEAELELIGPRVVVALGATAAQALLGPSFRLTRSRGQPIATAGGRTAVATYHPSAILRAPTAEGRAELLAALTADLRLAASIATAGEDRPLAP
jgi:uracil-DNA glycosylase family protein